MKKLLNFLAVLSYRRAIRRMERLAGFKYFKKACKEARRLHEEDNKRYRVFLFDEYVIWNGDDTQRMKNQRAISKKSDTGILSKNCYYDTQGNVNTHPKYSNRKV